MRPLYIPKMACNFFTYEDRLNTFDKWPREHEVNRIYLANHGFYYVRSRSSVKCAFCNGMHRVSEVSDRILSDHRCQNPLCQFEPHPDRPEDDNFDNGDEVPKEGPMHPKYSSLTARMHSFENWPNQMSQTPVQCAGAGFVYTGHDDDLRCFYCDGNLRWWKRREDPFHKHQEYFPHCPYIKAERRRRQNTGSENDVNLPQTRSNAGITDPSNRWNHPETPRTNMNYFGSYRPTVPADTGIGEPLFIPCCQCKSNVNLVSLIGCNHATLCYPCSITIRFCPVCQRCIRGSKPIYLKPLSF